MKLKHKIDYQGLEEYLKSITYKDIETGFQKPDNPKLKQGITMQSIELFNIKNVTIEDVINYGEPFLVDALGNDLSIVILSRRKYKLPDGRAIHGKFVRTIISDCHAVYDTALNGIWKIPSQFINPL